MSNKDSNSAPQIDIEGCSRALIIPLLRKHPLVARKLLIAVEQLQKSTSIEEYQQVGILIRDAWIEFAQKLFSVDFVPKGVEIPSSSDVKKMLEFIFMNWANSPKQLVRVSKSLIDLANEIQHKRDIDVYSAKWSLLITMFVMTVMLDLDYQHDKMADRKYYKCPSCGGLNLLCERDREVDFDGPGQEYERWSCADCDWEHFLYLV